MTMGRPTPDYKILHSGFLVHRQGMNLSYSFTLLSNIATRPHQKTAKGDLTKHLDRQMRNKHDKIQEYHTVRLTFLFTLTRVM